MSGPSIDLEGRNPLGGLDRLATGIGLAVIAVFPTLAATLFTPWKLGPMLIADDPEGRRGMILSPGAYLILSLGVVLIMVGSLVTPEVASFDGGMIGPSLAADVSSAAREGDVWKVLSHVAPIFIIAIIFGVLGRTLTRWAGVWWDLRVSLRVAFYGLSTAVCLIVLSSLIMDRIRLANAATDLSVAPPTIMPLLVIGSIYWIYFWCFRSGGNLSTARSALLAVAMFVITVLFFSILALLIFAEPPSI